VKQGVARSILTLNKCFILHTHIHFLAQRYHTHTHTRTHTHLHHHPALILLHRLPPQQSSVTHDFCHLQLPRTVHWTRGPNRFCTLLFSCITATDTYCWNCSRSICPSFGSRRPLPCCPFLSTLDCHAALEWCAVRWGVSRGGG